MKTIMIVDDHQLFRSGLKLLLRGNPSYNVVNESSNGLEMIDYLESHEVPDIILLDISMPEMDGTEAARRSLEIFPNLKIIVLTMFGEEDYYFSMVDLGVKGFLLKNTNIDELLDAMDVVSSGGSYFSKELMGSLVNSILAKENEPQTIDQSSLSDREIEIIRMICKGQTNYEIAEELIISKRTVEKHRANILEKTSTKNMADLVVYAIKNGLFRL